jgi:hypothetical protein
VAKKQKLFVDWTRELVQTVVDLAVSDASEGEEKSAPIHVIFFNHYEQRLMLEALARNFPPVIQATPPLYDFLTQIAAYDSPISSYLDEELRTFKNFPMTCQSLQSVAAFLKFDWTTPHNFRELFKARVFDYIGKLEIDGVSEWFTRRSRFSSSLPLEYAYASWGQLPKPEPGKGDVFADFRAVTKDLLTAFQVRRLEALEHVANSIYGNPNTQKTPFVLPDLAHYEDKAHDLAHALHEFVTIERLVELNDWKRTRHAPPERRVLMGETLLVRYVEADQEPGAKQNRENERRRRKREAYVAEFRAEHPDKPIKLTKDQTAECKWSPEGMRVKLRLETVSVDCDLHEALALSNLRDGDRLVLYPRLTVDERLPVDKHAHRPLVTVPARRTTPERFGKSWLPRPGRAIRGLDRTAKRIHRSTRCSRQLGCALRGSTPPRSVQSQRADLRALAGPRCTSFPWASASSQLEAEFPSTMYMEKQSPN